MPRPLFDSPYIFGIHEPGGEPFMLAAGRPGLEHLAHPADGDAAEDPVRAPAPAAEDVSRRRGHASASSGNTSDG